ncbi:NTP transferase domain-containing protein [Candidatus Woesearchaeota archaeon]|nr:NTP transferase domain-containing protein [Candidatus Woesearchaeota archaeon]
MKGVLLAGGQGTRLRPLTKVTNKHLLAVAGRPMIEYPLQTLKNAGLKKILVVTGVEHMGAIVNYIEDGSDFGLDITYRVQKKAGGIAEALGLAKDFAGSEPLVVILGDNYFEDNIVGAVKSFKNGAKIFLKEVVDPERFGVAKLDGKKVVDIEEKPKKPKSNLAVTGLYIFDNKIFDIIKNLKPSARGELEITDVNNAYLKLGEMTYEILKGYWSDMGQFESLRKTEKHILERLKVA